MATGLLDVPRGTFSFDPCLSALIRGRMVVHVGGRDRLVKALGEDVGIASGEAGSGYGVTNNDEQRTRMEGVDVDGKQLVRTDQGQGDQWDLGLDGHVGAPGHHGLKLAGRGTASLGKENQRKTRLQGRDAAVKTGNQGAGALGINRDLTGAVEVPADEGN